MSPGELAGILRSIALYRLRPGHHAGLVRVYRPFVPEGGLAFDIGAHVGDRVCAFRTLGARVIAVEPGTAALGVLRLLHSRDRQIVLVGAAVGAAEGEADVRINRRNPTVSTLSPDFVAATAGAPGWERQSWDRTKRVRVTTLDALIAAHGSPDFVKIDVEGHEAAVLSGLSPANAPPALSFEVVMATRGTGMLALTQAASIGYRHFRLVLGESHRFHGDWTDVARMERVLRGLPAEVNSGDIYTTRDGHPALGA